MCPEPRIERHTLILEVNECMYLQKDCSNREESGSSLNAQPLGVSLSKFVVKAPLWICVATRIFTREVELRGADSSLSLVRFGY